MNKIRSGIGYDIHRLKAGNGLLVGGVEISGSLMAEAHSDGDVLIHSLIDALLGAMGQPDIGELFPDSDPQFKGIASLRLLHRVKEILADNHFEILNIDCILIIEAPKISPFKNEIKKNITTVLQIPQTDFNIKAKTKEKIGSVGRGEALECFSTVMIRSIKKGK
jgi:2-C-methyl-D-erythritol 2,4-cyclodiphosphate synthase